MATKKREYIPANIRAGYTVQEASERAKNACYTAPFYVEIDSYDNGHDINGNGTAHYVCYLYDANEKEVVRIVESGKRREQVGYSGRNEAALYALSKLGFEVDTSGGGNWDYQECKKYPLLNFPPVESK